jgi:DNA-binding SARP family transcriptional activator
MTVDISLFGSVSVVTPERQLGPKDFLGRKPKQLLEILLLQEGRPVPKDQLAERLWGQSLPVNFSASLEHYVSLLRKRLDPNGRVNASLVRTVHGGYRCELDEVRLDTIAFDRVYEQHVSGHASRADVEMAVALAKGDLLEDEPYADWVIGPRAVYAQRQVELLVAASRMALASGDGVRGAELATNAVTRDSYAEPAHRLLMLAHYLMGKQSAALVAFDRCREHLTGDLGVDPLPETSRLQAAILRQESVAELLTEYAGAPRPTAVVTLERDHIPAPRASTENVLELVGRETELDQLVAASKAAPTAASAPVVLLDGAPGVGKTRMLNELAGRLNDRPITFLTATTAERSFAGSTATHFLRNLLPGDDRLPQVLEALPTIYDASSGLRGTIALQVLAIVADHGPFVAVIDDADNIDDVSAQVFACLAMRLPPEQAAFVFAGRCGELSGDHPLASTLNTTRITLAPLTPESLEGFGVPKLHERTGGLPLFVAHELARHNSGIEPDTDKVLNHFRRLGERLFHLCVVAAVMAEPIVPEATARITGRDAVPVVDDLELLCTMQVLRVEGDGFLFRNHAIRTLLASTASPARRQLLRGRTRSGDVVPDRRRTSRPMPSEQNRRSNRPERRAERAAADDFPELRTASAS